MSSAPHEKTESSFAGNQIPAPQDDDFEFIDSPDCPDSRPQVVEEDLPVWFVLVQGCCSTVRAFVFGSKRSGPYTRTVILERLSAGELSAKTLVWRVGLPSFVPVQTLFADAVAPPSPPQPPSPGSIYLKRFDAAIQFSNLLGQSGMWRIVGRSCAALGLIILVGSLLLSFWGATWFEGSILLTIAWLIAEAAAGVVDGLARIETKIVGARHSSDDEQGQR